MKGWTKPRVRVKSGQRFGVVERIEVGQDSLRWQCGCGSTSFRLMEGGGIACQGCDRMFHGSWVE